MAIVISDAVLQKLAQKHVVSVVEVQQCFENRTGGLLTDNREDHKTDPATLWFIALTNRNRPLKVCFIPRGEDQHIRTCYSPNDAELRIYRAVAKPTDF